jgi:4-hydroxy-3-methylbut-2-enyl diphosphate reductase
MGYCNGVAHVIELANECLKIAEEQNLRAYSIGWFIHNPNVVSRFMAAGMQHIENPEDGPPGVALIRAHGIGDPLRLRFVQAGFHLIDGTCGTVAYSQRMIRNSDRSLHVVLAGLHGHSEVEALTHVWDGNREVIPVSVVESPKDVDNLSSFGDDGILFMTQTTFPLLQYREVKSRMEKRFSSRLVMGNRLCPTTSRRLEAINVLCTKVDAVIVIGGRMSANTTALVHVVETHGLPVWHIESAGEIPQEIYGFERVGITAGTSTPPEDIEEVYRVLKEGI